MATFAERLLATLRARTVIGISTLGSGFTFTVIFMDLELQKHPAAAFDAEAVRTRLSKGPRPRFHRSFLLKYSSK
ncbi:hypothetical protein J3F83DRAFT_716684 [Trichoderma novae-zelandiae]